MKVGDLQGDLPKNEFYNKKKTSVLRDKGVVLVPRRSNNQLQSKARES